MYKRIISSLPYSPSLVGKLSQYAGYLRQERRVRLVTMIASFVLLAIYLIAVISPPELANKATSNDVLYGGFIESSDVLDLYDQESSKFRQLADILGISRHELANLNTINSIESDWYIWGTRPYIGSSGGEQSFETKGSRFYVKEVSESFPKNRHSFSLWSGTSRQAGIFAIIPESGNIITSKPASQTLTSGLITSIYASKQPSPSVVAAPGKHITYDLRIENRSDVEINTTPEISIADALEYATVVDLGGGYVNTSSQILSWPSITLAPDESQSRSFSIRIHDNVSATPRSTHNAFSYDCMISLAAANASHVRIGCPATKYLAESISSLPSLSTPTSSIILVIIVIVSIYLYMRVWQLSVEIRLIRYQLNTGSLENEPQK